VLGIIKWTRLERSAPPARPSLRLAGVATCGRKEAKRKPGQRLTASRPLHAGKVQAKATGTVTKQFLLPCVALFFKSHDTLFLRPARKLGSNSACPPDTPYNAPHILPITSGRPQCLQATLPPPHSDLLPTSPPPPLRDGLQHRTARSRRGIRLRSTLRTSLPTSVATALLRFLPGSNGRSSPIADSVPRLNRPSSKLTFTPSARGRCQSQTCLLP
jgi:hypothetical protein